MTGASLRVPRAIGLAFTAILTVAPAVRAGVNTWTGGRPAQSSEPGRVLIATDPRDPYVVYAAFQPSIYKSLDGGRTWNHLASFVSIWSLLVHPAAPDTLYAGVVDGPDFEFGGVVKSSDGGRVWERTTLSFGAPSALAGSPSDGNTVYAGAWTSLYKTTDGGNSWAPTSNLSSAIACLVVAPREPHVVYAGTESDFYYYHFGTFARSVDGGLTWAENTLAEQVDRVATIALEPGTDSALYMGLSGASNDLPERGIRRTIDGGGTFTRADHGLHLGANVMSLVIDPVHPSTLYAGTELGLYRSQDSGANWWAFGQLLSGQHVDSLAISADGRRLHAGLAAGAFDLDFISGPADVTAMPGGGARVLRWNSDRLAVQTVDGSNNWTATPFSGPSPTWTGVAITSAGGGPARVLWQNGDGRSALEIVGSGGQESVVVLARDSRWLPTDIAAGADGRTRLLFAHASGAMHVATVRSDGFVIRGPRYGPTPGWTAIVIDVAPDGRTWVLWRSADGRAAVSVHVDGVIVTSVKWGATDGWWVEDLAVGSDSRARVLARNVAGAMQIWTVGEDGSRSVGATHESPGLVPRRIAAGADSLIRVLWGGAHGEGAVWFLTNAGNYVSVEVPVLP